MSQRDKDQLTTKFNCVYYLLKLERSFVDYPELLKLQQKNKGPEIVTSYKTDRAAADFSQSIADTYHHELIENLSKARYYSILNDGSSDTSVSEKELVYVLLREDGFPKIKFVSIENVKNANAEDILDFIKESYRLGTTDIYKGIVGLNVDGASVNTGKFTGLGARMKEKTPWLEVNHCFNHRLGLTLKDVFRQSPAFESIESLITNLYNLYQTSPKRLRCLNELAEAHEKLFKSQQRLVEIDG